MIGMARAQWSPRVWELWVKRATASLLPRSCPEDPWYDTALPWQLPLGMWHRVGTLWHTLRHTGGHLVTPEKWFVVSLQPVQCGRKLPVIHRVQGRGDRTGKCWGADLSFCLGGLTDCSCGLSFPELLIMVWLVLLIYYLKEISLCIQVNLRQKFWLSTKAQLRKKTNTLSSPPKTLCISPEAVRNILVSYIVLSRK